jgi:hypothetical protein
VNAQCLDIRDQIPGRVVHETGMRSTFATAALIEEHEAILTRIEELPHPGVRAAAWSTVQKHTGLPFGLPLSS